MMARSWAPGFRDLVFKKIDERRYAALYSDIDSRPNFPVNVWVGLEVIKWKFDYTDAELLEQFHFNLLTAYALGLENLGELTLSERTLYYNRKRLLEYEAQTGRNLLEEEFQAMAADALEELGLNAKTQRMDSSFVGSFIKQMSRLELIVKVLQNFYRDLDVKEQARWNPVVKEYVDTEAGRSAYYLKSAEVGDYLQKVGTLLFELHQTYAGDERVNTLKSYEHIGRVLLEQFNIVAWGKEIQVEVKPSREISARSLQNPADDTATCRTKDGRTYKGGIFNVAETCAPGNEVQLLTDVCVAQNVAADDGLLAERLPAIKERTGVGEMVVDANYTGEASEKVCQRENVIIIPTEVRGHKERGDRLSLSEFHFDGETLISCPEGHCPIEQGQTRSGRHVVRFARDICHACPMVNECPAKCRKRFYSLIFYNRQALLARRRWQLSQEDYRIKCRLRAAIEGTISQFKHKMPNGKLRIRGLAKIRNSIILMAIGINFGRVWAYLMEINPVIAIFLSVFALLVFVLAIMLTRQPTYSVFKHCGTVSS
jgi:hypothetical protein